MTGLVGELRRGGTIVVGGVTPITGDALRAGARADKFGLRSTAAGDYDVAAEVVVVQRDGIISIAQKQTRGVTVKLP
jgi:propanediol dehydratase small subunit